MLVNGTWTGEWHPTEGAREDGRFKRWDACFRDWVTVDGSPGPSGEGGFRAEAGRYHLVAAYACPWASRTLIARELKGLTAVIGVTFTQAEWSREGWRIADDEQAALAKIGLNVEFVHQIYARANPCVSGRASVPLLWDRRRATIVSNESADILRMLDSGFGELADDGLTLRPADLEAEIDELNAWIYPSLNNGVYRAGFASTQQAYEEAFADVFAALDRLEARLAVSGPFLLGERFTEADVRVFVTLVRFDAVYHGLFKCNLRRVADYARLSAFLERIVAIPEVGRTVNIDHIKRNYYSNRFANPSGIVPRGPALGFLDAHAGDRAAPRDPSQ